MNRPPHPTRYNQPIPHMGARTLSGLRLGWRASFLLAVTILPSSLRASTLEDTVRQFANKIAAASGPGTFRLDVSNRSSLDDKTVREITGILETQLNADGVGTAVAGIPAKGLSVVLSETVRDYVWTARIYPLASNSAAISDSMPTGSRTDERVVLISLPRPPAEAPVAAGLPMVLRATLLFSQQEPILDLALAETSVGARLIVLNENKVGVYRPQSTGRAGSWQLENSLPITHAPTRTLPRDLRGRLLLRHDHLFDLYLPGTFCQSSPGTTLPFTLSCQDHGQDDLWPLTADDSGVRAFFATSRNFFTGSLSPAIGKIANVQSFYSAAAIARPNLTLWIFAAVDGSVHLVDGIYDQLLPSNKWGSDLAAVHSNCGSGTHLLVSESSNIKRANKDGSFERDALRAFELQNREPIAVSPRIDFDGRIAALWPESNGMSATAIVKNNTGWYDAYRVSISCGN